MILTTVFAISILATIVLTYLYFSERRRNRQVLERLERIDLKGLDERINRLIEEENKYFSKVFEMEIQLENYRKAAWLIGEKVDELERKFKDLEGLPRDYQMTYRDVVRKVLELDNKFTEKFKLLAEALVEVGKKKKG